MKPAKNINIKSHGKVVLKNSFQANPIAKKNLGIWYSLKKVFWHKPRNLVKSPKIKEMWHTLTKK